MDEWKVYALNDCDWYVARSLDEAKTAAASDWCCGDVAQAEREEMFDDPRELTGDELDSLTFVDDNDERRSFREELARRVATGHMAPGCFASTEY